MKTTKKYIGIKFNNLLVLRSLELHEYDGRKNLLCVCDCGKEVKIRSSDLTHNKVKSCGCGIFFKNKILICKNCALEFIPTNSKSTFCSNKCKRIFWDSNNQDKIKKYQYDNNIKRLGTVRPYDSKKEDNGIKKK
jgi:hypothetical protein